MQKTLYDKLWGNHVVHVHGDGTTSPCFDRHRVHQVTNPQSFEGLTGVGGRIPLAHLMSMAMAGHFADMCELI